MIDRGQDGTELGRREEHFEERRMVGTQPADAIATTNAELPKPVREAANSAHELTVGPARLPANERRPIRCDPGSSLDPRADPSIVRHSRGPAAMMPAPVLQLIRFNQAAPDA